MLVPESQWKCHKEFKKLINKHLNKAQISWTEPTPMRKRTHTGGRPEVWLQSHLFSRKLCDGWHGGVADSTVK